MGNDSSILSFFTESIIFSGIFAVVLFYFIFFQPYLSALIWRSILYIVLRKSPYQIKFERISFSILTGQLTLHRLKIITQDMEIRIARIRGRIYYWRKPPDYYPTEKTPKKHSDIFFDGLEIVLYNRTWSTQLVETVIEKYRNGESTEDITQYLQSLYPESPPSQLSIVNRMLFPLKAHVNALSIKIGNPHLPHYVSLYSELLRCSVHLQPRMSVTQSMKMVMNFEFFDFKLNSFSNLGQYNPPENFNNSMRDIQNRINEPLRIINTDKMIVKITKNLYGTYVNPEDVLTIHLVTEQPTMKITVHFEGQTKIEYGPFTDKIRSSFMRFFTPFTFNNPILFPDMPSKVKYWNIEIFFDDEASIVLPFVTKENRHETLTISFGPESNLNVITPNSIAKIEENKMQVQGTLNGVKFTTSYEVKSFISAKEMKIGYLQIYPIKWHEESKQVIQILFNDSQIILHPYHIDFLSQLGTDWGSYYPFDQDSDSPSTFMPNTYTISLIFQNVLIVLFSEKIPPFEQVIDPNGVPHIEIYTDLFKFQTTIPFTSYKPEQKQLSFITDFHGAKIYFINPITSLDQIRRGSTNYDSILISDTDNKEQPGCFVISGFYRWTPVEWGGQQIPMNIKIKKASGLVTVYSFFALLNTLSNYTSKERLMPADLQSVRAPPPVHPYNYISHTFVNVSIGQIDVKLPIDMYDNSTFFQFSSSNVLLTMEGHFPFWHMCLHLPSILAILPRSNFVYDRYFDESVGSGSPKEGLIHIDGLNLCMRALNSRDPIIRDIFSTITMDIGKIEGFLIAPHLVSMLELVQSALGHFYNEEVSPKKYYSLFNDTSLSSINVFVDSSQLFLDMGSLGFFCGVIPSGIAVYADSLIQNSSIFQLFVQIPVIDAHFLIPDESHPSKLRDIFRTTLFVNVFRSVALTPTTPFQHSSSCFGRNYHSVYLKKSSLDHSQESLPRILSQTDIEDDCNINSQVQSPHHSKNHSIHTKLNNPDILGHNFNLEELQAKILRTVDHREHLLPFLWNDMPEFEKSDLKRPDLLFPDNYNNVLEDNISLLQVSQSDPLTDGEYSLLMPKLDYKSMHKFLKAETTKNWLHLTKTRRLYTLHDRAPGSHNWDSILEEVNHYPPCFASPQMRITIPHAVFIRMNPFAIQNIILLGGLLSTPSDWALLASIVRSKVNSFALKQRKYFSDLCLDLPLINLILTSDNPQFKISLIIENLQFLSHLLIWTETKEITILIQSISISAESTEPSKSVELSEITKKEDGNNAEQLSISIEGISAILGGSLQAASVKTISINLLHGTPELAVKMTDVLYPLLSFPSFGTGNKNSLVLFLKSLPEYNEEYRRHLQFQYQISDPIVSPEATAELNALYTTHAIEHISEFSLRAKFFQIPKATNQKESKIQIKIAPIDLTIFHLNSRSYIKITPDLIIKEAYSDLSNGLTAGVSSIQVDFSKEMFDFVMRFLKIKEHINTHSKAHFSENVQNRGIFMLHGLIRNIDFKYGLFNFCLQSLSCALKTNPDLPGPLNFAAFAELNSFTVSIKQAVNISFQGFSLSTANEVHSGVVHMLPINIDIDCAKILDINNLISESFGLSSETVISTSEKIKKLHKESKNFLNFEEEENADDQLLNDDVTEDSSNIGTYSSNESDENSDSSKDHYPKTKSNKMPSKISVKFIENLSLMVLIDPINIHAKLAEIGTEIVFPRLSGILYSYESNLSFFTFLHCPIAKIDNYFSFPLTELLYNGTFSLIHKSLMLNLMIGKIEFHMFEKNIITLATIANKVLSFLSKKQVLKKQGDTTKKVVKKSKKKNKSKFSIMAQVILPQFSVNVDEISSRFGLNDIILQFELSNKPKILIQIHEICLNIFKSSANLSWILLIKEKQEISFDIESIIVHLAPDVFGKFGKIAELSHSIIDGIKKQSHINSLLHDINTRVTETVQKEAKEIFNHIGYNIQKEVHLDIPFKIKQQFLFIIHQSDLIIILPDDGEMKLNIPLISLLYQERVSDKHNKSATAAEFKLQGMKLIFDTLENKIRMHKNNENNSSQNHLNKTVHFSSGNINAFQPKKTHKEDKSKNYLSTLSINTLKLSGLVFQKHVNLDAVLDGLKLELFSTFLTVFYRIFSLFKTSFVSVPESKGEKEKKKSLLLKEKKENFSLECYFKCADTLILLSPISNKLPIDLIDFQVNFSNDKLSAIILIPSKISAIYSAPLIDWLGMLIKDIKETSSQKDNLLDQEFKKRIEKKTHTINNSSQAKSDFPDNDSPSNGKQTNFGESLKSPTKANLKKPLIFEICFKSNGLEAICNCGPDRTDISCVAGVQGIVALISSKNIATNIRFNKVFIQTATKYNTSTSETVPSDFSRLRLFEFTIPTIDAFISTKSIDFLVGNINISASSNKLDEIVIIYNAWVKPLLFLIRSLRPLKQKSSETNLPQKKQKFHGLMNNTLIKSSMLEIDIQNKKNIPSISAKMPKVFIKIVSLALQFNYSGGIGSIFFNIGEVHGSITNGTMSFSVNSVQMSSNGQLIGEIKLGQIKAIKGRQKSNNDDTIVLIESVSAKMQSLLDPFLYLNLGNSCLIYQMMIKQNPSNENQILKSFLVFSDNGQLKLTSNFMTILRSAINAIIDPVLDRISKVHEKSNHVPIFHIANPEKKANNQIPLLTSMLKKGNFRAILNHGIQLELYKYYFNDNEAVQLSIMPADLEFDFQHMENGNYIRNLRFSMMPVILSRQIITEDEEEIRSVLKIPAFSAILNTIQKSSDNHVSYDFITDFKGGSIEPSLTISDYEAVVSIILYVSKHLKEDASKPLSKKTQDYRKSVIEDLQFIGDEIQENEFLPKEDIEEKKPHKISYEFIPGAYQFAPEIKVGAGASISPNLQWLLTRLGIKDEHIIPSKLFETACLGLEKLLHILPEPKQINNQK